MVQYYTAPTIQGTTLCVSGRKKIHKIWSKIQNGCTFTVLLTARVNLMKLFVLCTSQTKSS